MKHVKLPMAVNVQIINNAMPFVWCWSCLGFLGKSRYHKRNVCSGGTTLTWHVLKILFICSKRLSKQEGRNDSCTGRRKLHTKYWLESFKGKYYKEDLNIDGRAILKLILRKLCGRVWNEFIWIRIICSTQSAEFLEWLSLQLAPSEELKGISYIQNIF
jgi:hypothetical protein